MLKQIFKIFVNFQIIKQVDFYNPDIDDINDALKEIHDDLEIKAN